MCVLMADELSGVGETWIQHWQGIGVSNVGSWKRCCVYIGTGKILCLKWFEIHMWSLQGRKFQEYRFPGIVAPQNGWFIMDNPTKWMILWYPYLWRHPYIVWNWDYQYFTNADRLRKLFLCWLTLACWYPDVSIGWDGLHLSKIGTRRLSLQFLKAKSKPTILVYTMWSLNSWIGEWREIPAKLSKYSTWGCKILYTTDYSIILYSF